MSPARAGGLSGRLAGAAESLYPGSFAVVMATGIISNAFLITGYRGVSDALLAVNLVAWPAQVVLTALRAVRFGPRLWRDLTDPRLVFSFFTFVAGSDVLGVQLLLRGWPMAATALWLAALAVWVVLSYFSFSVLIFTNDGRGAGVVHGGWLIAIVGTQSLVLLGTLLAPRFGVFAETAFVALHALWGIGIMLYGMFVTLFSSRIFFQRMGPDDALPLFWVVMGAAAISANAGSAIIVSVPVVPFLTALRPFVEGMTLVLWAWGTWWIPLLVIVGVWKHVFHRVPLVYHPMYWSLVFPLGMYSVASYRLSLAAEFVPLVTFANGMSWVALGAWAITMVGWARQAWRGPAVQHRNPGGVAS